MKYEDEFEPEYEDDHPDEAAEDQDIYTPEESADSNVDLIKVAKTMYRQSPAPPEWDLQKYIEEYARTKDKKYLGWFLHHYENTINLRAESYLIKYAMQEHFADIKQSIDQLSDAAMSTGVNYVETLRRFQQMKKEETGGNQC